MVNTDGNVHCSLVLSKAHVVPTNVTTIPHLELSAAVVAARMSIMLRNDLDIDDLQGYFWTDSKVVLGYINNDARRFHVFVANRIQRIKSTTEPKQWRSVKSDDNPADQASRGLGADQLVASNWFTGPAFLWEKELPIEYIKVGEVIDNDPELRKVQVLNTKAKEERTLLDCLVKFSDWNRAVKAIAYLKRHAKQIKGLTPKTSEATSVEERQEAELCIIKLAQKEAFRSEIKSGKQGKEVRPKDKTNKLHKLSPFVGENGVLRVGGHLTRDLVSTLTSSILPSYLKGAMYPPYSLNISTRRCNIKEEE